MRPPDRTPLSLAAALVLSLLALPPAAAAVFVLYFQPIGGWSVLCWRADPPGAVGCPADAPPPAAGDAPAVVVHVTEAAAGAFVVTFDMRADVPAAAAIAVTVDGGESLHAALDREYRARIDGPAAGRLVAEMLS